MILAQNPEEIPTSQPPQNATVTKVHGFSKPTQTPPLPHDTTQTQETDTHPKHNIKGVIYHWWHKIALILLTAHGLVGLFESFKFLLVEYPELSHMLEIHQVNTEEVNHLLAKAIITFVVTFVNVLFAIRLSKVKETTAHSIDLLVATFLIISTQYIQNFLFQLDLLNLILPLFS
jgi:hypothetical protein